MNMLIEPINLKGSVKAITSKSYAHRVLICAALSDKSTTFKIDEFSEDILATISCLEELGAKIEIDGSKIVVYPIVKKETIPILNCKESGSTLRFLLPVATTIYERVIFKGEGRLPERPLSDLVEEIENHGVKFSSKTIPFETEGKLNYKESFNISGNISSQYISGLLLAAGILEDEVEINITTKLESKSYIDLTVEVMEKYGIEIVESENKIVKRKSYKTVYREATIENDWSNAAFFLCASALGDLISVEELNLKSLQPDREIVSILRRFGAKIEVKKNIVNVYRRTLKGITIELSEHPDLLPVLAVVASISKGETKFINGKRLRFKESDRIKSTVEMINDLGGMAMEEADGLTVIGIEKLKGGIVNSRGDHRIVMAAAVASIVCENEVKIIGSEAVNKSYPKFFEDFKILGGDICRQ